MLWTIKMRVEINGAEFLVQFSHNPTPVTTVTQIKGQDPVIDHTPAFTSCHILMTAPEIPAGNPMEEIATGVAMVHPNDAFVKNTGRKIALGRALRSAFPDNKATRTKFWEAYREMRHGNM